MLAAHPVEMLIRPPPNVESYPQLSCVRCKIMLVDARAGRNTATVRWAPLSRISLHLSLSFLLRVSFDHLRGRAHLGLHQPRLTSLPVCGTLAPTFFCHRRAPLLNPRLASKTCPPGELLDGQQHALLEANGAFL